MKRFYYGVWIACVCVVSIVLWGCSESSRQAKQTQALEEKVFVVNIVPDSLKLKEYLDYHEHVWPEVEAGFKKAGYQKIVLYRYNYLLVMIITVPAGADLNEMGKLSEAYDPRCAEWNKLMGTYQRGVEGTLPGQTWVEAKSFYRYSNSSAE